MIYQLEPSEYGRVSALFEPLQYQGILTAVLARHRRGKVFVDDRANPRSGFAWSPGPWCFLAGNPDNASFNDGVRSALFNKGLAEKEMFMWLWVCDSAAWQPALGSIARPRQPAVRPRLDYCCTSLHIDGRDYLPPDFTAQCLDKDLFESEEIVLPQDVVDWLAEIGTPVEFFEYSFGFVALHGRDVAAWCLADGIAGSGTELGVFTQEPFREQGLATALTALAVEHAFSLGLTEVSWQCAAGNTASIRIAEKVGFRLRREYPMLAFVTDEEKHAGWLQRLATEAA